MITAPTDISNCQVWLDASDTTSLFQLSGGTTAVTANLDPVGYWGDKSGNNRHFTNIGGSATTRPTWVSSLSTVRFDGSNDYLSSFFNITYTAQTVFVVVSQRSSSGRIYTQVSSGGDDQVATGHYIPLRPVTNSTTIVSRVNNAQVAAVTTRGTAFYDLVVSCHTGSVLRNFINGVSSSIISNTLNYSVALSRLGANANSATIYLNGDISEVIVYNRALTNNERADVEYYLTRKWNFLNSIPRQTYAIKNGLWSDSATWSVSAEPSPWNFPLSADNAYTNTFTVTADSSTRVDTIRNSTLAPNILSGGSFVLANGVSLSANVLGGVAPYTLTLLPAASSTLVGNITGASVTSSTGALVFGTSSLIINGEVKGGSFNTASGIGTASVGLSSTSTSNILVSGNVEAGTSGTCVGIVNSSTTGTISVIGNVTGNQSQANGISNIGSGIINITGNITGGVNNCSGVANLSTGAILVAGSVLGSPLNVTGSTIYGISNGSTGTVMVTGNVYGGSSTVSAPGIFSTTAGSITIYGDLYASNISNSTSVPSLSVYGNIINAPNGRQAIYAPRYQVFPSASATYTRQAVNGYDSYTDYWTSDATFSYPASSDVVLSTVYSNNTLSGSMALPPASAVALGASVGTTTGTASITLEGLLSQPIAALNTLNSIGARLKNVATTQALSAVASSLDFNN